MNSKPNVFLKEKEACNMLLDYMLNKRSFDCSCYHFDVTCRERFFTRSAQVLSKAL